MSIAQAILEEDAQRLGRCPQCQRVLTHWRGRHTGRWVVRHVEAMCPLAEHESEPAETADEARDAWIAGQWAKRQFVPEHVFAAVAAPKQRRRRREGGE